VGMGQGGVLTGRCDSALRQEARFLLVTADLFTAAAAVVQPGPARRVNRARARARPHHHWAMRAGGGTRAVARPGDGTPARYPAPEARARSLDI
jgi:hypothetical protein